MHACLQNTMIQSVAKGVGVIRTEANENVTDNSGLAFVHCYISGSGDTYLSQAWRMVPRVVFAYTYMATLINGEGWSSESYDPNKYQTPGHFFPFPSTILY